MLQKGAAWRQSQEEPALAAGGGERANILYTFINQSDFSQ